MLFQLPKIINIIIFFILNRQFWFHEKGSILTTLAGVGWAVSCDLHNHTPWEQNKDTFTSKSRYRSACDTVCLLSLEPFKSMDQVTVLLYILINK